MYEFISEKSVLDLLINDKDEDFQFEIVLLCGLRLFFCYVVKDDECIQDVDDYIYRN